MEASKLKILGIGFVVQQVVENVAEKGVNKGPVVQKIVALKILRRSVDTSKKHHAQIQCFLNFITIISLKETIFPSSLCLK